MSELAELDLHVKTLVDLEKCEVTTPEELTDLHLLELIEAGAGLRVLENARRAQLEIADVSEQTPVSRSQVEEATTCPQVEPELIGRCEGRLEADGWTFEESTGQWKYWNKVMGAVNWMNLFEGQTLVHLRLTQN